ncbi:MAG: imidazole glycerol phosphate synthase subunit HisH [Candidatus Omnitrophica bacterium]|nr:imidazole glycerol phosphate synthase subunit HisH [Candidatus Omnitrophota bacterium]MBD3269436.1 imidazole glycerol phosphate synthase subunit HisH [Candidatus Omnitrophota bacterium]
MEGKIREGTPFLGICLGMQLLFEESQESEKVKGLGVIPGEVKRFDSRGLTVPHMGWNRVELRDVPAEKKGLFKGIRDKTYFYFAHSYYCFPSDKKLIFASTPYGVDFASCLNKDNIWAVQFHPEKSQKEGLKFFDNFLKLS